MVKSESRIKNSTRNIVFSMIAYIIQIILGFFVRRYFIYYFGEGYLGISQLFSNILSLLSLAVYYIILYLFRNRISSKFVMTLAECWKYIVRKMDLDNDQKVE